MKKFLLLAVAVMLVLPAAANAKAVKLGRGKAYSISGGSTFAQSQKTADCSTDADCGSGKKCDKGFCVDKPECTTNSECPADKKCSASKCVDPCLGVSCPGVKTCVADSNHSYICKGDACDGVSCAANYEARIKDDKTCCCEALTCPSGQRMENGTCVSICSGVSCNEAYNRPVANGDNCCCEFDSSYCSSQGGKVWHTLLKKCVDAMCPTGCIGDCTHGCQQCSEGYYLTIEGKCDSCSKIENCTACNGTFLGPECVQCASGYTLNASGQCEKITCPDNCKTCSSSTTCTVCEKGYKLSNGKCTFEPITLPEPTGVCGKGTMSNMQNCGSTGCCPKDHSCSYYASQKASKGLCMLKFNADATSPEKIY